MRAVPTKGCRPRISLAAVARASIIRRWQGIRTSPAKISRDGVLKVVQEQPMKTIAQFVRDRITLLTDLQDALQTAMQLEFSTIPPYLCAMVDRYRPRWGR